MVAQLTQLKNIYNTINEMINNYNSWLNYFDNWNLSEFGELEKLEVENLVKELEKINEIEKAKIMKMYLRMANSYKN